MEIEQVAELARTFAALPQSHRDFFDGIVADERAKDAKAKRTAKLQAMGDFQALDVILKDARRGMTIFDLDTFAVAKGLVEAGFERRQPDQPKVDLPEAITRIREVVQEIEAMNRRGTISNAPSLKHWLLRGLDALTGENHSGFATSLPQPKTRLA